MSAISFANQTSNTGAFTIRGGQYSLTVHGSVFAGPYSLQRQAADAATFVNVMTPSSVDSFNTLNIPDGTYRIAISSGSNIFADLTAIATIKQN